jgi:toxin ParE1/3/4
LQELKQQVRERAAETDVAGHARYQERSVEAAIGFLDAFDAALDLLGRWPEIGGVCDFKSPPLDGMRVWPISGFKSYLIFYRIRADELEVVRVIHGARDLGSIFRESDS